VEKGAEVLPSLDPEIEAHLHQAFDRTEVLRLAAPLISTIWLNDLLKKTLNPQLLEFQNSDGEEISFLSLYWRLLPGVTVKRLREALDQLPDLRRESATFWNWLAPKDASSARLQSTEQPTLSLMSTLDDGSVVLGSLELKGKTVVLSVNSEGRAECGRAMLASALEGLVGEPLIERQTLAQVMADRSAGKTAEDSSDIPPEEKRRITYESLDRHYRTQLDEPIPVLGNITPRQAAKRAKRREKLVAWLKRLENNIAQHEPTEPMAGYDVKWMWEELGVDDFRK
jgi:hypothetical protein